ncbi:MAG: site-specific DNA-methyltransferase [Verrucomicrobiae bacterium]|nr:site-specific DNA-methyltransferase [Verrucomicrobiae bacterium]
MPQKVHTLQEATPRTLTVVFPHSLSETDRSALERFLHPIPSSELACTLTDTHLEAQLVALDFHRFEGRLKALSANGGNGHPPHSAPFPEAATQVLERLLAAIGDIRSYGISGKKRLYAGYADERKVRGRKAKVAQRSQFFYAAASPYPTENTELPASCVNRILCADSETALKELPANCVDLVFTSPPYNFGLDYNDSPDTNHWPQYFKKLFAVFDECVRVLKHGGRIIVNLQPLFSDYIPSHHIVSHYFMEKRLIWKGEILWEKNNYNCKYTAWGSWRSPSNPYLKYTWEFLEIFCKGTLKKEGHSADSDLTADEFKKWVVSRWSIAPERKMKEFGHPAMFPEELAARVIKMFSFRNDVVLDPFNGVGTTTVVAKQLGRRFLGIDVSREYCAAAEERLRATLC